MLWSGGFRRLGRLVVWERLSRSVCLNQGLGSLQLQAMARLGVMQRVWAGRMAAGLGLLVSFCFRLVSENGIRSSGLIGNIQNLCRSSVFSVERFRAEHRGYPCVRAKQDKPSHGFLVLESFRTQFGKLDFERFD